MLKGMVNAYKIETRNASWLYSLFWYPAVVAKGRYTLHIWYAAKSYNQLLIPCRSDMKLTSDWYQTVMRRIASGLITAWPERGGVYDSWQMRSTQMVDQIVMKFTCIAHCTQTPIYTNIFLRIDVNTCPLLVKPLDTGGFHSQRNNDAGAFIFL